MLPSDLIGPGECITFPAAEAFLSRAFIAYPELHPDFIRQACCEHPDRMDEFFPDFDLRTHRVVLRQFTVDWIEANLRYDGGELLSSGSFYGFHIDRFIDRSERAPAGCRFMIKHQTWAFPPIVVEAEFADRELGSPSGLGRPFHLFEGTHRVSYLLRLYEKKVIAADSKHSLLLIEGR